MIKKILKRILNNRWIVRSCRFPYPEGYATYNPFRKIILDTGLTKKQAEQICEEMNKEKK